LRGTVYVRPRRGPPAALRAPSDRPTVRPSDSDRSAVHGSDFVAHGPTACPVGVSLYGVRPSDGDRSAVHGSDSVAHGPTVRPSDLPTFRPSVPPPSVRLSDRPTVRPLGECLERLQYTVT
jgi:hypothetical protein